MSQTNEWPQDNLHTALSPEWRTQAEIAVRCIRKVLSAQYALHTERNIVLEPDLLIVTERAGQTHNAELKELHLHLRYISWQAAKIIAG